MKWTNTEIVYRVARKVAKQWGCPEYRQDLEHECWALIRDIDSHEGRTGWKLMNWVLSRLTNHMKSKQANYSYQDDVEHLSTNVPLPEDEAKDAGFEEHLIDRAQCPDQQVIETVTLEECERLVGTETWGMIVLNHGGWTQKEIGDMFGIDQPTVSIRITQAKALLCEKRLAGEL